MEAVQDAMAEAFGEAYRGCNPKVTPATRPEFGDYQVSYYGSLDVKKEDPNLFVLYSSWAYRLRLRWKLYWCTSWEDELEVQGLRGALWQLHPWMEGWIDSDSCSLRNRWAPLAVRLLLVWAPRTCQR